jgi:GAF domain-containing protein/two-component sensor histidine kinase
VHDSTSETGARSMPFKGSSADLEQQIATRTRELSTLNAIAAVVSRSLDLEEILEDALDETIKVMGLDMGGIYLLDEDAQVLNMATSRGFRPGAADRVARISLEQEVSGRVARTGQPVVTDQWTNPFLTNLLAGGRIRSLTSVPMTSKGKVLGTLFVGTRRVREFSQQDVQLLTSIGHQIGVAIENARLYEVERRRAEQFRLISEVGRRIVSILDVEDLLSEIAQRVSDILGYYLVGVGLIEGDDVVMRAGAGPFWEHHRGGSPRLKVGKQGIVGQVAATGRPQLVGDVAQDPHYFALPQIPDTVSELAVPLRARDKIIGVLDVQSTRMDAFDQSDVVVLQSLADQAAMAIDNARLFEAQRRLADQYRLINEVGRRITAILDIDQLLDQMARMVQETLGYDLVEFGFVDGDEVVTRVAVGRGGEYPVLEYVPGRLRVGQEGIVGWVAGTGEPLLVGDVAQEPRYVRLAEVETRSELAVPIKSKGDVIGVLNVESDHLDAFDESDLVVLQSLANQVAVAIDNARLFDTEERRAEQFRVISEVGQRMISILPVKQLLEGITELLKETLGYYLVGIALVEGGELVFKAGAGGAWERPGFTPPRLKVDQEGITGWVARTGESLLVGDVSIEPRYYSLPEASEIRSELAVPLGTTNRVIGVLHVQSDRPDAFDESDLGLLQSLANQASVAIENARLYDQAHRVAVVEERQRLARDLHDSVTQALYGMTLYSEAAIGQLALGRIERVAEHLRELQATGQEAMTEMRLLIYELRPPVLEEEGLVGALQARLQAVEGRVGLKTEFETAVEGQLLPEVEEGLYRIAQEALNNVLKHANAASITVRLRHDQGSVALEITDDGTGFDPRAVREHSGLGLSAMEERAAEMGGKLVVTSSPGEGTRVHVEVCV